MERKANAEAAELSASLELAAAMARLLPSAADPSLLQQIYSSLTSAHQHLSSFLSLPHLNPTLPQPPDEEDENSDESAINAEPMLVEDEIEEQDDQVGGEPTAMVDEVEEKMREHFFIRNKRPKRAISPSSAAEVERRSLFEEGTGSSCIVERFDPNATRLRNLELIYQFHC